jgi:hypothetical protein
LGIRDDSPAAAARLSPFFDFIVGVNGIAFTPDTVYDPYMPEPTKRGLGLFGRARSQSSQDCHVANFYSFVRDFRDPIALDVFDCRTGADRSITVLPATHGVHVGLLGIKILSVVQTLPVASRYGLHGGDNYGDDTAALSARVMQLEALLSPAASPAARPVLPAAVAASPVQKHEPVHLPVPVSVPVPAPSPLRIRTTNSSSEEGDEPKALFVPLTSSSRGASTGPASCGDEGGAEDAGTMSAEPAPSAYLRPEDALEEEFIENRARTTPSAREMSGESRSSGGGDGRGGGGVNFRLRRPDVDVRHGPREWWRFIISSVVQRLRVSSVGATSFGESILGTVTRATDDVGLPMGMHGSQLGHALLRSAMPIVADAGIDVDYASVELAASRAPLVSGIAAVVERAMLADLALDHFRVPLNSDEGMSYGDLRTENDVLRRAVAALARVAFLVAEKCSPTEEAALHWVGADSVMDAHSIAHSPGKIVPGSLGPLVGNSGGGGGGDDVDFVGGRGEGGGGGGGDSSLVSTNGFGFQSSAENGAGSVLHGYCFVCCFLCRHLCRPVAHAKCHMSYVT